ncbi:hypothetical protein KY285_008913 [Solanum tuberosum]|nr:hypothetical protein KY285_008913 [Solanum tuberosum]
MSGVLIVGIWGMPGVGKMTIARAIFDTLSYQFEAVCFLVDIKENKCGMHFLQNILLSELLKEKVNYVNNKEDGRRLLARRLRFKKVLVVLDDIDHIDQLDYLAGNLGWFGNGSRIIATTRDKHLIGKNVVYELPTLHEHDAIKLFERYAFKEQVSDKCFKELTLEVVSHAKGLPLALKVFGCFFHERDITEWRSAIKQIKNNPNSEIVEKLKISYDGLETIQQSIFLDIACFLRGRRKDYVMQILESCDFGADIGLSVLSDKSLVSISGNNTIEMHDLIQDMGKYVVKKQKDPGERSRLWLTKDFEEVMINNTGTKAVEAIWVPNFNEPCFSKEAMTIMQRLRILCIHDSNCLDGSIEYLPNSLRWFVWNNYPCESLPENFEPQKLVHLDLSLSSLHHLWTGKKHLPFLQKLDLRDSRSLMQTPDFTWMPNLKYLDLSYCRNLSEVHHSLGYSRELIELNLYNCGRLKRFPCVNVESLDYMDLEFCSSLEKFPIIFGTMKQELKIKTGLSGIKELPSSVTYQTHIINKFGFRRYKDEPELESLLQMRENNDEPTEHCIGTKRSRYDNSEPRDEASCSSSKKQREKDAAQSETVEEAGVRGEVEVHFPRDLLQFSYASFNGKCET